MDRQRPAADEPALPYDDVRRALEGNLPLLPFASNEKSPPGVRIVSLTLASSDLRACFIAGESCERPFSALTPTMQSPLGVR